MYQKKTYLNNLIISSTLLFSFAAHGFSVPDHKMITEIAIEELKACKKLPAVFNTDAGPITDKNEDIFIEFNLKEDNYIVNGIKKLTQFSHFYNPLIPLKPNAIGRTHANNAVDAYTIEIENLSKQTRTVSNKTNLLQNLGMITHMVQDASSPLHVLYINHAFNDGFENKVPIERSRLTLPAAPCNQISLSNLKSPMEILKSSGLATMKELEEEFQIRETNSSGSNIKKMKWNGSFFANSESYNDDVLSFLKSYNHNSPNINSPSDWLGSPLNKGQYGNLSSEILNATLRGDYFSYTTFRMRNGTIYNVEKAEYEKLRIRLLRQSVLNTQRLILWLGQVAK